MDIKVIRELAQKYSASELEGGADEFENKGSCRILTETGLDKEDPNDQMSALLQASEVRRLIDNGLSVQEAVREFSKRVRSVVC